MADRIELMLDQHASIGESPTWSAGENALYWIDVKEPSLHRLADDGSVRSWRFGSDIGAFALTPGAEGAVAALRTGLVNLRFDTGKVTLLAPPPFDPGRFRFNEGICDRDGRFWVGVMLDPVPGASTAPGTAALHCFTFANGLVAGPSPADLHNGFAWTRDGREFVWSHSNERAVFRAAYNATDGTIGAPRPFLTVPGEGVLPDGAAVDEEGCYWCAVHGGSAIHRYDPSGALLSSIGLPVSRPTMCAFVGAQLDEMVVTSASHGMTPDQLAREPHAGGLFRLRTGVRGLPRPCIVR